MRQRVEPPRGIHESLRVSCQAEKLTDPKKVGIATFTHAASLNLSVWVFSFVTTFRSQAPVGQFRSLLPRRMGQARESRHVSWLESPIASRLPRSSDLA